MGRGRLGVALEHLLFWLVVRPLVLVVLGLNVRHRHHLPRQGPAILAANHNSHLDTLVLMTLLPARLLHRARPVAAADYFLANRPVAWFSLNVLGILPVERRGQRRDPGADPLASAREALDAGELVLLFPEGSRGDPERLAAFKSGLAHLARSRPEVPVIPVFMHGLGKSLPRGSALPVPFFCDVFVGPPLYGGEATWGGDHRAFMAGYSDRMQELSREERLAEWS